MRQIIVSNRAPVNIVKENGRFRFEESSGGLASGLRAYTERMKKTNSETEIIWIGWPGIALKGIGEQKKIGKEILKKSGVHSVFLSEELMENFYQGFCNKTIWPLFHYFPAYTVYEKQYWEHYVSVNEIFAKAVLEIAKEDDTIWVHDYHLMLLPALLRKKLPGASIGFFLHIPFPSFEMFRLLPSEWRKEILQGLYGSDLIGFHTHDYRTYFLRSTLRILGLTNHMGEVSYNNRHVKVDSFPMGIDYSKYHGAASTKKVQKEKIKLRQNNLSRKLILSIDRQDYSKGILNRLEGYGHFLKNNSHWKQKVTMMMVIVPSRIGVEDYQAIKKRIDELVGRINGEFGTLDWQPILYQYRSLSFEELIALYNVSDVALVTPLRDGMNLIAKEYVASRTDNTGVLILSEMAGSADELAESIIINPNNIEEISSSMLRALEMNEHEQQFHLQSMQQRIKEYDIFKWADDFLSALSGIKKKQERLKANILNPSFRKKIISEFKRASTSIIFLDYDGTLVPYASHPDLAVPGKQLLDLISELSNKPHVKVIIISGRERKALDKWFGKLNVSLAAEHGIFIRQTGKKWRLLKPVRKNWKKRIKPIMQRYAAKLPGAFVEEKEFTLAFHYRKCNIALADLRIIELMSHLESFTSNMDIIMVNGEKVLEMRNAGIDKGVAAMHWLSKITDKAPFILAIGDGLTDEDLFRVMPARAYSIKVSEQSSYALFNFNSTQQVFDLLKRLI